jgi:hypothetical protein
MLRLERYAELPLRLQQLHGKLLLLPDIGMA